MSQPQISGGITSTNGGTSHRGTEITRATAASSVENKDHNTLAARPPPAAIRDRGVRVDAQQMVDRGEHVLRAHRVAGYVAAVAVDEPPVEVHGGLEQLGPQPRIEFGLRQRLHQPMPGIVDRPGPTKPNPTDDRWRTVR